MTSGEKRGALRECPFCGGVPKLGGVRDGYQVRCPGTRAKPCFAAGPIVFGGPAGWDACQAEAIAAWSTRKSDGAGAREVDVHCTDGGRVVVREKGAMGWQIICEIVAGQTDWMLEEARRIESALRSPGAAEPKRICAICTATVATYPEGMCCHCREIPWPLAALHPKAERDVRDG